MCTPTVHLRWVTRSDLGVQAYVLYTEFACSVACTLFSSTGVLHQVGLSHVKSSKRVFPEKRWQIAEKQKFYLLSSDLGLHEGQFCIALLRFAATCLPVDKHAVETSGLLEGDILRL